MRNQFRRSLTVAAALALSLAQLLGGSPHLASAAPGDVVADVVTTDGQYVNNNVAFDGRFLYYSDYYGQVLHRIDVPPPCGTPCVATVATGKVDIPVVGIPSGIDAIAYDVTRDALWVVGGDGLSVYLLNKTTGMANLVFAIDPTSDRPGDCKRWPVGHCVPEVNGLAYDRSDDTLWYNADMSLRVYHYQTRPDALGTAALVPGTPYIDIDIPPNDMNAQCGWNATSGVAVGGDHLFIGSGGCAYYFEYTKTGTKVAWYSYPYTSAQDIECDNVSFPVSVLWIRDAWDWHIRAFEQPSADACRYGGG